MSNNENLDDSFGIEGEAELVTPVIMDDKDIVIVDKNKNSIDTISSKEDTEEDYNLSRNTLHQLISAGQDSLEGALDVAKNSDSPRAYEVVATTFKNLADCAEKLLQLHKAANELDGINVGSGNKDSIGKQTNNTFFVGTTEELHALLDGKVRGEE